MTPREVNILERIAVSLERLADHFAPKVEDRQSKPAVLGTAIYSAEEREKKALRETLKAVAAARAAKVTNGI